jgi:hypothetical protein
MRLGRLTFLSACLVAAALPAVAATRAHRGSSSHKASLKRTTASKPKLLGQRGIDDSRATELQTALIRAGYLSGEPSGHWDAATEAAMGKLQGDNGWQTKLVPDSRAIIKLGLGPSAGAVTPSGEQTSSLYGSGNSIAAAR